MIGATGLHCCPDLDHLLSRAPLRALSDPSRAAIVGRLALRGGSGTVGEIAACCPLDMSVVSRHLATLRRAGVLSSERRGKEVHYRIRFSHLARMLRDLADAVEKCCPGRADHAERSGKK